MPKCRFWEHKKRFFYKFKLCEGPHNLCGLKKNGEAVIITTVSFTIITKVFSSYFGNGLEKSE